MGSYKKQNEEKYVKKNNAKDRWSRMDQKGKYCTMYKPQPSFLYAAPVWGRLWKLNHTKVQEKLNKSQRTVPDTK